MKLKNIYPICVSLSEKNAESAIAVGRKFPFVEVRLDYGEYTAPEIKYIFRSLKNTIATCRPGRYDDKARLLLLVAALNSGARFVDIEIEASTKFKKTLVSLAQKRKARSIISYHNFKLTPSKKALKGVITKAKRAGANVVKIATHVRNEKDVKTLLSVLSEHDNLVVVGMGEAGKAVRIASPMLGGIFTFAAPEVGKETAPGQIEFQALRQIYSSLGLV